MPFQPGNSGNPAGRPTGQPNRVTSQVRDVISEVLAGVDAAMLQQKLEGLQGKDFVEAYAKLAEFVTPKLQRTSVDMAPGPRRVIIKIGGKRPALPGGPAPSEDDDEAEPSDE
ncbi:MAG: DUF5681 domain-containing protein [Janthinobacterium lividum]